MNVNNSFRRHVFKDLRPYVCTYEECAEGDQQYDDSRDWVGHEVNTHLGTEMRPSSPSERSSGDRVLSLGSSKSPAVRYVQFVLKRIQRLTMSEIILGGSLSLRCRVSVGLMETQY